MGREWKRATLGDLGPILTGKTPPTSEGRNYGGQVPFVTPSDMDGRRYIHSTRRTLTPIGVESVMGARIPAGAVMISCIGSDMGKAAIASRSGVTNQQINSIIVRPPNVVLFVYYELSQRKDEIRRAAGGSAQPILNKSAFGRLPIMLPPIEVQQAIAHILGTLDDKIELNRQMNETLEAMARALFKSWFVDFDPVRAKAAGRQPAGMDAATAKLFPDAFEMSELGEIPRGWRCGRLEDVLVLQRGFDLPSTQRSEGRVPIISAGGPSGFHNDAKVSGPGVVTGRSGLLGQVYFVHDDYWPLNTTLWVKDFKIGSPMYAFQVMKSIDFGIFNSGSAVPSLNRNHVHGLATLIPQRGVVSLFERTASDLSHRIKSNEIEARHLALLRDTLLPPLLSGELSIPDAERFVGRAV